MARAWLTRAGIVEDPYAQRFLGRRQANIERFLWWTRRLRLGQPALAYLAARTRFYDAVVIEGLDSGIDQVVLVGAGYDTRAWRLARPDVQYYEVDHPATQSAKRTHAPDGEGPVYVPADLAEVSLGEALSKAGFQPAKPSVICCEGLTMYLTETAVRELLCSAAAIGAPQSLLGVEFGSAIGAGHGSHRVLRLLSRASARAGGEPIVGAIDPATAPDLLADCGWAIRESLPAPALQDRYLHPDELPSRLTHSGVLAIIATPSTSPT